MCAYNRVVVLKVKADVVRSAAWAGVHSLWVLRRVARERDGLVSGGKGLEEALIRLCEAVVEFVAGGPEGICGR